MLSEHHITGSFGVASFPCTAFLLKHHPRRRCGHVRFQAFGRQPGIRSRRICRGEEFAPQRQQISTYIEGFFAARAQGPEHLEELGSMLVKFCAEKKM